MGLPMRFVVPAAPVEGAEWARTLAYVRGSGTTVFEAARGTTLPFATNVRIEVLAPSAPPIERSRSDVNANGIVLRVVHTHADHTFRFLLTGDAELPTEARLLENPEELRADVLKVAHHGSSFSSSLRFLEAVAPTYAVISAAEGNDYGHPHGAALERLLGVGARILRTDLNGEIAFTSASGTLEAQVDEAVPDAAEAVAPRGDDRNLPRRHRWPRRRSP
jgi:competence protein ComEC